jgi:predicted nuclease of restriction endonuclease-like RecB superfamily
MLTKDLLRVSRAGGGYHPQFVNTDQRDDDHDRNRSLAARVIGTYQGHVGEQRGALDEALTAIERESDDFKLVRGFAKLLEREATFETQVPVEPERARRAVFEASETVGVVTEDERTEALSRAADDPSVTPDDLAASLYADLESRQVMTAFDSRWGPDDLLAQYDLSLAQTALFDATEIRVRSSDPKVLVSSVKRLRLMYEIRRMDEGRTVYVTGPDALFRRSRRYGTRFARLLRTVANAPEWHLEATIDDKGTERTMTLTHEDVSVPNAEPVTEMTFDSGVEADFATRFSNLDLDWELVREPEPLAAGAHVVIPDFAFDWHPGGAHFRVFFEIMGFWTPEYVEKKLSRLADLEDVEMLVAVDESLGVGEQIEALDHRAIPYTNTVRVKDVRDTLRPYETEIVERSTADLPDELTPGKNVVTLTALADTLGVSEAAIENKTTPDHERIGRTLVRPVVLTRVDERIEPGMSLSETETILDNEGIDDTSALLSTLGYRVDWDGLSGGTVREK